MKFTRRFKFMALGVAGFLGMLGSVGMMAHHRGWCGHGCHGEISEEKAKAFSSKVLNRIMGRLDATDTQRQQMTVIKDKVVVSALALRSSHKGSKDEALNLFASDAPDKAQVHALVDRQLEQLRTFLHGVADAALEAHAVLTPKQRGQVVDHVKNRHSCKS